MLKYIAPDGVPPPMLISPTSTSITATWGQVGRWNSDSAPTFQLQFRLFTDLIAQKYVLYSTY